VQHALRAFTPRDQKAVKAAADTLRPNPDVDVGRAITELAVGEALVSLLDGKGTPTVTERAWIVPPASRIGPITDAERESVQRAQTPIYGHYTQGVDRESAYEKLKTRTDAKTADAGAPPIARTPAGQSGGSSVLSGPLADVLFGTTGPRGGRREGMIEAAARSAARSVGSGVGRAILRGALGSILGGARRRR
jgi:hypothetical protein